MTALTLKLVGRDDPTNYVSLSRDNFIEACRERVEQRSLGDLRAMLAQALDRLQQAPDPDKPKARLAVLHQVQDRPTMFIGDDADGNSVLIVYYGGVLKVFIDDELFEWSDVLEKMPRHNANRMSWDTLQTLLAPLIQFPPDDCVTLLQVSRKKLQ